MRMTFGPIHDDEQRRLREDFARVFQRLPLPQDPTKDNPERAREAQEASDRG